MKLPIEPWHVTYWREVDAIQEEKTRRTTRDQNTQIARALSQELGPRETQVLSQLRRGFKRWHK